MKTNKKQLSIIIPCYNVEKYIINCLESIKNQLNSFLYEIILVDDKSTDNSVRVINEYLKDSKMNIKLLVNEKNSGAGYSRNKAIKEAKYEYISFIDADDYLNDNFYDEMFTKLEKEKADIVVSDFNIIYEDGTPSVVASGCEGKINKLNMINTGFAASPCNKIIKKELLEKYPFAQGIMNEDVASIIAILVNAKKISYTSKTRYNYVQHSSSVQNSKLSIKRFDIFKAIDILKERINDSEDYEKYIDIISYQQLFLFYIYVLPREKNFFKRWKYLKLFKKMAKDYNLINSYYAQENLFRRGKKARFYYTLIFNLNDKGFSFLTSLIMSIFNIYHNLKHNSIFSKTLSVIKQNITLDDLIKLAKKQARMKDESIKVSVVIPNYNYEKFMYQRLYSILYQDYKLYEIIILDDCSQDNSRELIDELVLKLQNYINIKKVYNKENSGSTFKQWKKGFDLIKGDYVWIAEADDYCEKKMISSLINIMKKDSNIVLSYVDTSYINAIGIKQLKTIKPEIDIQKSGHWDNDFINDGLDEIRSYAFLNCTIANVSSCLIKNNDYTEILEECGNYKQAGDWLFYVSVMKQGKVSFVNKPLNYYRVHGNNVTSTTKKEKHIEEIQKLHKMYIKAFGLTSKHKELMKKRIEFLKRVWDLNK